MPAPRWISCQLGAREHYAIPRALHAASRLHSLLTDYWASSPALRVSPRLRDRWHPDLATAPVHAANFSCLAYELRTHLTYPPGWPRILARNHWFQQWASRHLSALPDPGPGTICFAYAYAAHTILHTARQRGWTTILGQIDPGPVEERLTAAQATHAPAWAGDWTPAPTIYWHQWRQETEAADLILVNSPWSRQCLLQEGIPDAKIRVIPLAFSLTTPPSPRPPAEKRPPGPLRVLFLGQANIRKGIHDLAAAAHLLLDAPLVIDVVGPHPPLPANLPPNLRFHGPVPRAAAATWYAAADLFILPTHSDGFALTQLEAMAHGLPVIATPCCGQVVEHGVNGWIIPPGDPSAIASTLRTAATDPSTLEALRPAARQTAEKFRVPRLTPELESLIA